MTSEFDWRDWDTNGCQAAYVSKMIEDCGVVVNFSYQDDNPYFNSEREQMKEEWLASELSLLNGTTIVADKIAKDMYLHTRVVLSSVNGSRTIFGSQKKKMRNELGTLTDNPAIEAMQKMPDNLIGTIYLIDMMKMTQQIWGMRKENDIRIWKKELGWMWCSRAIRQLKHVIQSIIDIFGYKETCGMVKSLPPRLHCIVPDGDARVRKWVCVPFGQ